MIEAEWEDLQRKKLPRDSFTRFARYFQLNLDETLFLCNESELNFFGSKINPAMKKMQWLKVFNNSLLGWYCIRFEWSSDISGKGNKGVP